MKFRVKSIIAYMIIACMLMTFMPVLAAEGDNYIVSDFTEVTPNASLAFVGGYGEIGNIKLENNRAALRDYFYYDYDTTETSNTETGLYDAESGAYVLSGVNAMKTQNWSKFIDDFKFQGTYNGTTYTLPITSYGTTDSHTEFQFIVDYSAYSDVITASGVWAAANWTDVKIINEETGKVVPVPAGFNYGLYTDCYRVYFSKIAYIAEQLPEYFEVGPKLTKDTTTSGSKKIYAYGMDEAISNAGGVTTATPCKFTSEVSLKFSYKGKECTVPINRVRADSSYGALYFSPTIHAFNLATGAGLSSFSSTDINATNITDVKLTPTKVNIGSFPASTVFISAVEVYGGTTGNSDGGVIFIKGNSKAYNYTFSVEEAGKYDVYCLTYDSNDTTQRAGKVYVNDKPCSFMGATNAPSSYAPYWEPAGTVTLGKEVNILNIPVNVGYSADSRFGGIAFVPASENFELNATESATLASYTTGVADGSVNNAYRALSTATKLTSEKTAIPYEEGVVNVTVNGEAVAVTTGAAMSVAERLCDANGSVITAPTVADAIISAGLTLTNASGQICAAKVNGKTVYPSRTLVYEGMEITYIDGAGVTKADFSPVFKNTFAHASLPESSSLSTGVCMYVDSNFRNTASSAIYYTKLFPFATQGTATTEAADNNLINCQAHGYFTVLPLGATSLGVAEGGKIYFTGNPIVKIEGTNEKLTTGPDANGHITMAYGSAFALDAPDGSKVHMPYAFYNQRSKPDNTSYYDASECFIANTSATNDVYAQRIKAGKYQLLTTGTVPCQIMIMDADGAVKSVLKDQVVTGVAPLTITLEQGEKAYVWGSAPYNGNVSEAGIYQMKPLCETLTY